MPKLMKHIRIDRPTDEVFGLIADHPEQTWWPSFEVQQRVTPAPTQVGSVFRYVYDMLGVRIKGEQGIQALIPNERLLIQTTSGFDSSVDFQFERLDHDSTLLTIIFDYRLPGALLGKLFSRAEIELETAKNLEIGLNTLKHLLEHDYAHST